jgi:GT2 family glycosyltransferase
MVNWSLLNGFSWLLSVDSDIIMPKHSLQRLLDIQDQTRAISSGTYIQRKEDQRIPEIYIHNPETGGHKHLPIEQAEKDQILDVEAVGFGCCLVRRDVFEKVGNPWFTYHSSLEFNKVLSEDVDFCMKAKNQGYQVVVDTGLKLGHISKTVLQVNKS